MTEQRRSLGCFYALLVVNASVLGLLAFSFGHGPYSSAEQELWYRYGSLGLFVVGAVIPALAILVGARRSNLALGTIGVLMFVTLVAAVGYAMMSGGGV